MEGGERNVVAGFFATQRQAMTVQADLRRIGLDDQDIDIGRPASGRYRVDVREAAELGSGALDGIIVGTLVGALLGVAVLALTVPQAMGLGSAAVVLGVLMGGFWGSFFGGLAGMAIKAISHEAATPWRELPEQRHALIVVARAGAHADAARKAMRRRGAGTLFQQTPGIVEGSALTSTSALTTAMPRENAAETDHAPRSIAVPRGAFLLLIVFLVAVSVLWANVYLRVVWRA